MANNGWIKMHRQLMDKGYYRDSAYVHLWLHLLFKANHEGKEFLWNNKMMKIRRGQILTGRSKLVFETGIERNKIERILKCFENEQQIEQQTFSKFRLITVNKYEEYQKNEQENEPQVSSKRAASEQQMSTNKNEKNYKNEKNIPIARRKRPQEVKVIDPQGQEPKTIPDLLQDQQPHIKIIGLFAKTKHITFETIEQQRSFIVRNVRAAKALAGYSTERIEQVMEALEANADFKWTLETVGKYIDEDLSKLNKTIVIKDVEFIE